MLVSKRFLTQSQLDQVGRSGEYKELSDSDQDLEEKANFDYLLGMQLWSLT